MTRLYNVFIREHQIVRFSIEVRTEDVRAAILEAGKQYEQSGTQWSVQAETEIDDAEITAVDELDPKTGAITQSFELDSLSASVGAPIDLSN
jgi:hypothetical protein